MTSTEPKKETNPFTMSVEELDAACTEAGLDSLLDSLAEEADTDHTLSGFRRAFAPWILDFAASRDESLIAQIEEMKYGQFLLGTPEASERVMTAVNTTIDQIAALIRSSREAAQVEKN